MNRTPEMGDFRFSTLDYTVFSMMLVLSAASGVYFGFCRRKISERRKEKQEAKASSSTNENGENTTTSPAKKTSDFDSKAMDEYLLGSRKMKAFPVAMSLVGSYISGVTILGTPSEIYNFGTQYWLVVVAIILMGFTVTTVYLPVFCALKVASSYEYLEIRFNSAVRTIISVMFIINEIQFLPIIIYVPSLALNQVTGLNIHLIGGIVTAVCIFYTLLGGLKAVVQTDAWQVMVMFLSVVVVVVLGTIAVGGPTEVFRRASEGGRLEIFNYNPSPYVRHSIWTVLIGQFLFWTSHNAVNQTMIQRYMALPNLKTARISAAIFIGSICVFVSLCCYAGVLAYAAFYKCDPITAGYVKADDQILPFYVMKTVGHLQGVPGLFIAGVFGGALSSLSVVLNSTAGVLYKDIVKGCFKCQLSERAASLFVKGSVLVLGCLAMAFLFIIEKLGGILAAGSALAAIGNGTTFGVFTLGMLIPWATSKGALAGAIAGALMSGWVSLGSQAAIAAGLITPHKLDVSIEDCPGNYTVDRNYPDESNVFPLYRLSYNWINPIGIATVLVVGTIVSFLTGPRNLKKIDPELISPVIHKFLPTESFANYGTATMAQKKEIKE